MTDNKILTGGIALASGLWFWMFSPWTQGLVPNFWGAMTFSAAVLLLYVSIFAPGWKRNFRLGVADVGLGLGLATLFWGVFWAGDKISAMLFSFARPQVNLIYTLKDGSSPVVIGLMLLLVIGPAEEIFWRGFVEGRLIARLGKWKGFIAATLVYAIIHVWSGNFMLIMAALVIGALWGFLFMLWPGRLGAIIISHALWDLAAFVVFPF